MSKVVFRGAADDDAVERRKELGKWLQGLRKAKKWTQVEAAKRLDYEWYTFISQVEGGHARIPTEAWETWADVYGVETNEFLTRVLRAYDPALLKIVLKIRRET
jgi:transcriptional regulator with XRE-family HTH domain